MNTDFSVANFIKMKKNRISISSFPNPASDKSTIRINLKKPAVGKLVLFDITGQTIAEVDEGYYTKGRNNIVLDTSSLSEGIYFYSFTIEDQVLTNKLIISR